MSLNEKNIPINTKVPDSYCPLPWSSISINTKGSYRLCCYGRLWNNKGKKRENFHVSSINWKDFLNSKKMKSIRLQMLKGKFPKECIKCETDTKQKNNPMNLTYRNLISKYTDSYPSYIKAKTKTKKDGSISLKNFPISFLEIRPGNFCNLKCIMCNPVNSSKWYEDWKALTNYNIFIHHGEKIKLKKSSKTGQWKTEKNTYGWSENTLLSEQLEKYITHFNWVYFAGGEPLLIKAHSKFLEKCIEKNVAKQINLKISSNITHIPPLYWKLWRHFKSVRINASLDSFGKINNLLRYPSQWENINKNLDTFEKMENSVIVEIKPTISILNIWHLPQFIEYIMAKNYKKIGTPYFPVINPQYPLFKPYHLNVRLLEDKFKEKIIEHFKNYKEKISNYDWQANYGKSHFCSWEEKIKNVTQILDQFANSLYINSFLIDKKERKKERKNFIVFMDKLDQIRKTSWKTILPELYENTLTWRNL